MATASALAASTAMLYHCQKDNKNVELPGTPSITCAGVFFSGFIFVFICLCLLGKGDARENNKRIGDLVCHSEFA